LAAAERVICVVQARTGSTRLPGKVLADLGGKPLLRFMLDRLSGLAVDDLVVATSDLSRDQAVAEVAAAASVAVVRGSEGDVLDRFRLALDRFPAAHVVRLTADCPLMDPAVVEAVVERHRATGADYTSNVLPRTFPKGLDVEVARGDALLSAAREATDQPEREHVTPFLYRHPERFRLANLRSPCPLGDENWCVDTPADLDFVRDAVTALGRTAFSWKDVLAVVGRRQQDEGDGLRLRPAGPDDADLVLAWRNDDVAVRYSRSGRVESRDHQRWYAARLDDPATRLWMAESRGQPVGYVRLDVRDAVGRVSLAVAPERRGSGLGTTLLGALLRMLDGDFQVRRLEAEVHVENEASLRLFASHGFTTVRESDGYRHLEWEHEGESTRPDPREDVR